MYPQCSLLAWPDYLGLRCLALLPGRNRTAMSSDKEPSYQSTTGTTHTARVVQASRIIRLEADQLLKPQLHPLEG